nr:hypothetical protein GCM10020185_62320 [Pseudomonas brassicacearum subsp. brassicacearum]
MSVKGTKQGLITAGAFTADSVGNTYQEGHEDQVMVQAFEHQVTIPRDPQSGQPTGQRIHKPLTITKVFDKASPLLQVALTSGERLEEVKIQWYRTSAAGTQEHYYTTTLEDAIIVDIKDYMLNCQNPEKLTLHPSGGRALHVSQKSPGPTKSAVPRAPMTGARRPLVESEAATHASANSAGRCAVEK